MKLIVVALLFAPLALAQKQTATATTSAQCSPIAPDNSGIITIKCAGLTPDQERTLAGIPALLNRVLRNQESQKDETSEMMSKLDNCIKEMEQAHNGVYTGWDYNGARRNQSPGQTTVSIAPEMAAYQNMINLESEGKWKELLETSDNQIKTTPDWLTPYLLSGIANLKLGNRDAAIERLKLVRSNANGESHYSDAGRILSLLGVQ